MLQCYTIKENFMKKRFTVMLDEKVIQKIKELNKYWTPSAVRHEIETTLAEMAENNIYFIEKEKKYERK